MKWLQDNPLGKVLAAISGIFVLLALAMAIVWNIPVSVDTAGTDTENTVSDKTVLISHQVGSLSSYQVINEKPVFNESRTPVISATDDALLADDATIEIKGAPDVRLTGVVIAPGMKIASLTPAKGNQESIMAHEGQALTGEFVGWQVVSVNPRLVVLESRDGQKLELELQVHDATIKEPPKPVEQTKPTRPGSGAGKRMAGDDDAPLSRAEQIRQRIAERREELRLEQEEQQSQSRPQANDGTRANEPGRASQPANYQSAIRAMMNKKPKDQGNNDK